MCSIPGLPTQGSEVPVVITRVKLNHDSGLVELWVNMDDGQKHIYEQMREDIWIPKRRFCGSEGKPGDLCLVSIRSSWHRARIVMIQKQNYSVYLIDQGQSHIVTGDALAWGNSDSFLLPPEIESCILANVLPLEKNWPEEAFRFLKSLSGKSFKGLVQQVLMPERTILLDIPTVSKHMCNMEVARKLPAAEFQQLVLKCLHSAEGGTPVTQEQSLNFSCQLEKQGQYFYPELLTDSFETVVVTEVISPNIIFCKLLIFSRAVEMLSELIHKHYEESCDSVEDKPQTCGDPCVAKGMNGRWHRSVLKQNIVTRYDPVEVLHVDEGKTEVVPIADIRPLNRKFLKMPVVTYPCSLNGVKDICTGETAGQIEDLKLLLLNQTVVVRFENHSLPQDVYYVSVYDDNNSCINDSFIEKTELLPPSKAERVEATPSSPLGLLEEQHMDLQNKETSLSTKKQSANGITDCVSSSATHEIHIKKESRRHSEPLLRDFTYSYSTHNIEVGNKEKVWITSAESVHHFFCQLERNAHLFGKVMDNVKELIDDPQIPGCPLGLNGCCLARYTDGQWYRGKTVEIFPMPKVHFVDYGDTLTVTESDICLFPAQTCVARSVPMLAVPLALFDVAGEVPQDTNQWFVDHTVDHSLTISVVETGDKGKLIVELFDGSVNINVKVRERILKSQQKVSRLDEQSERQLSNSQQAMKVLTEIMKHDQTCECEELKSVNVSIQEADQKTQPDLDVLSEITQFSVPSEPEAKVFKRLNFSQDKAEQVYASCIVGPHYFWCQYADTENLNKVSMLAQEATEDGTFPETLCPGSPCLAQFSSDNQWYRAQVIQRSGDTFHVLFVDYGNEADVDMKDVRSLPQSLLDVAPQAFLCSLNDFDEAKGFWDDQVYDYFYKLLVDKPLRVTVFNTKDNSEFAIPHYAVEIENNNIIINCLMQKYWNPFSTEDAQTKASLQGGQTKSNVTFLEVSTEKVSCYLKPNISTNDTVEVYASVIVEPNFFWCQFVDTEDLGKVLMLAQDAPENVMFPETLSPGRPCLARFSSDNQWYRAQVIQRSGDTFHVLFVDYGNESDVYMKDVRSLPESLLDVAPQAFLCSLNGFDETKGYWDDQVYDDFYKLLIDKPLRVTVFKTKENSELAVPHYDVEIECEHVIVNNAVQKNWKPAASGQTKTSPLKENTLLASRTEMHRKIANVYKKPKIINRPTIEVYASVIVEPNFFWCQFSDFKNLNKMSILAQDATEDVRFPETLGPGSPCLARFSSDNQWYRAQVIQRNGDTHHVLFVDYGNESDVDMKDVRSIAQSLLEETPQAFLCSLNGFDEAKGSWDDQVYDEFYNLLVDKPLRVTVFNTKDHSELAIPHYAVEIECEGVILNTLMEKYWKELGTNNNLAECSELVDKDETWTMDVGV